MRKLLAFAFLILAGSVEAGDCRIRRVILRANRSGSDLVLRALYVGFNGRQLNPRLCPDQQQPTWGLPDGLVVEMPDAHGYKLVIKDALPGWVYLVNVASRQWSPEQETFREFLVEKAYRF